MVVSRLRLRFQRCGPRASDRSRLFRPFTCSARIATRRLAIQIADQRRGRACLQHLLRDSAAVQHTLFRVRLTADDAHREPIPLEGRMC